MVNKIKEPTQNGVTKPGEGTIARRVWNVSDQLTTLACPENIVAWARSSGINERTAETYFYSWRKFHGHN